MRPGRVLYLALEDGPRRLTKRLAKVLAAQQGMLSASLEPTASWARHSDGGLYILAARIDSHPDARLIIVDTPAHVRDRRTSHGGLYEEDNAAIAVIQTLGLTGAADAVLVLKRPRYQYDGTLFIIGRDVDEQELAVRFDPQYCLWSITENAPDRLPAERRKAVEVLTSAGQPMPPLEVAARLGKGLEATKKLLKRMADDGIIGRPAHGQNTPTHVPTCPDDTTSQSISSYEGKACPDDVPMKRQLHRHIHRDVRPRPNAISTRHLSRRDMKGHPLACLD